MPPSSSTTTESGSSATACWSSGPNRLFLRYIAQVLPSLGETSVVQTTVTGLGTVDVRGTDTDAVAALKGDLRLAEVIERAAWGRTVPLAEDVRIRTGFGNLTLTAAEVNEALATALADRRTVASARDGFRAAVQRAAFERLVARRPEGLKLSDEVATAVRTSADLRRVLDRAWPAVTAPALVRRLLTNRAVLAAAADGVLDDAEQRALRRKAARRADDEAWTAADVVLIDEADAVLGGRPRRFGHLVVDEAQDVSAMAWRMLGRRCARTLSMTVLGDLAQSTAPAGQSRWDDVVAVLGSPAELLYAELDVGYRVPEQILALANGLLPHAGVDVAPTRSARSTAALPEIVATDDLPATVTATATGLAAVHASVAVIAPEELHPADPRRRAARRGGPGHGHLAGHAGRVQGPRVRRRGGGRARPDRRRRRARRPPPLRGPHPCRAAPQRDPRRASPPRPR